MALLRKEMWLLREDKMVLVILVLMPLALMAFVKPTFQAALRGAGYGDATGAEQAVPGLSVMFAFFLVGTVGIAFYHEFTWWTWDRARAAGVRLHTLVVAKLIPPLVLIVVQQVLLLLAGRLFFDLRLSHLPALLLTAALTGLTVLSFAALIVALSRSFKQVEAVQNVSAIVFGGLGGALTPLELLPSWARSFSELSPAFWSVRAYQSLLLTDEGAVAAYVPWLVLSVLSVVFLAGAVLAFGRNPLLRRH